MVIYRVTEICTYVSTAIGRTYFTRHFPEIRTKDVAQDIVRFIAHICKSKSYSRAHHIIVVTLTVFIQRKMAANCCT